MSVGDGVGDERPHISPGQPPPECERYGSQQDNSPFPITAAGEAAVQVVPEYAEDAVIYGGKPGGVARLDEIRAVG